MVINQYKAKRSQTGARFKPFKKKRLAQKGRLPANTKLEEKSATEKVRTKGGGRKVKQVSCSTANISDPKTKKIVKAKILSVLENPANRHFVRRNIITKGTVIETDKGKARVSSRPGQDGTVNAVLVK